MKLLDSLRVRIAALFHPSQVNTEMEEELRSHIQLRADDLERSGVPRPEAERRARIEFGGREKYKEECHEALSNTFIACNNWRACRIHRATSSTKLATGSPGTTRKSLEPNNAALASGDECPSFLLSMQLGPATFGSVRRCCMLA